MDLPDDHWENLLSLDLKLDMVKKIDDLESSIGELVQEAQTEPKAPSQGTQWIIKKL